MKELKEAEKQETEKAREVLVSLDVKQTKWTEYKTNIVNIEKNVSDLQTCVAIKQMEKEVETQDLCLQSLVNSDSLDQDQTKLLCKIDSSLMTIANSFQKLAK